ncbi:MAG: hypothetical protein ACK4EX_08105 [Thermaurantimonas sp.]|uniref:hypothetical protein n=1 Tax=Thermaurantimonas sp. TaxID=2681568 RepID=UPI00391D5321
MFWTSIVDGIGMFFSHWEIWVGILIYGTIFLTYFLLFGFALSKGGDNRGVEMAGCLIHLIAGPALQGILVSFLVTAIFPILCGGDDFISLSFLTENWWAITKAGLISICITLLLSSTPFVDSFIYSTPGTSIFVQGVIVFRMLANKVLFEVLDKINPNADIFLGFWTLVGLLILSFVIHFIISSGLMLLLINLEIISSDPMESMDFVIDNIIGVFPGILCLCIYCSFIRLTFLNIPPTITS